MCDSTLTCDGKALEGKPKEAPKEDGKGGEPKLPEIPQPKGGGSGGGQPQPKDEECQKEPKPEHCKSGISNSLMDNFKNLFSGSGATETETTQTQFVTGRLKSFLGLGESADTDTNTNGVINNPTEADVIPVPSASQAGGITSSGGMQGVGSNTGTQETGSGGQTVTGFGSSGSADVNTSTGPILSALRSITARIQSILSSWLP